ncbi:cation:proton antiporter [Janibacter alkaliphilus]|uniref:Putative Kef-type K+ transport protein n=1 Tax=Janibacter alkaliphilus TaxID=1069963 RepID=A0A852XDU4_9MICO|nr:cation:proton antiporter [Janibacter alkaliphilus]NYG36631.1 putative Kef-type K+ transport protein [Janibacter alkaliphilus]
MEVASTYLVVTFGCALLAVVLRLPPLVGFLSAGFLLAAIGADPLPGLEVAADLGVTLLLFGIGLKLDVRTLVRPEVWVTSVAHMGIFSIVGAGVLGLLSLAGLPYLAGLGWPGLLALGFALSYSSTVLVVKVLEDRGEQQAFYGRIALGVLVIQDLAAVLFIVAANGELPSPWVFALVLLWPLSRVVRALWGWLGHGEMQALFGILVALVPGYALFEALGLKGDLGALVMGLLLAGHPAATELSRQLSSIKDVLLIGFFINIGMTEVPQLDHVLVALVVLVMLPLQGWGYAGLLRLFRITRHATSRVGLLLANFSEFGLIVTATASATGWVSEDWLTIMALAVAASFVLSAAVNRHERLADEVARALPADPPRERVHPECRPFDVGDAEAVVIGIGRVGTGAAHQLADVHHLRTLGVEQSRDKLAPITRGGIQVIEADGTDTGLVDAIVESPTIRLVVLALPAHQACLDITHLLHEHGYTGVIAAAARYEDHARQLRAAGVDVVLQVYAGAGAQLADEARALTDAR